MAALCEKADELESTSAAKKFLNSKKLLQDLKIIADQCEAGKEPTSKKINGNTLVWIHHAYKSSETWCSETNDQSL